MYKLPEAFKILRSVRKYPSCNNSENDWPDIKQDRKMHLRQIPLPRRRMGRQEIPMQSRTCHMYDALIPMVENHLFTGSQTCSCGSPHVREFCTSLCSVLFALVFFSNTKLILQPTSGSGTDSSQCSILQVDK